jgi:rifampicin phosphotransferase
MGPMNTAAPVIALDTPAALDAARVGRKAANLAAARAAGLPVAPGVVLTADWSSHDTTTALQVWRITSHDGVRPLVVRPSAAASARRRGADCGRGALEPVTVVHDGAAMLAAIAVLRRADAATPVLIQPHVPGDWRGVLFADDSAGGWRARSLVVADAGGGEWIGELDHAGRVCDVLSPDGTEAPDAHLLGRLARIADKVTAAFDGPHDLEWVIADDGRVQLLRVRPVVRLHATPNDRRSAPAPGRELVRSAA